MRRFLSFAVPLAIALAVVIGLAASCYRGNPTWPGDPTQPRKVQRDAGVH